MLSTEKQPLKPDDENEDLKKQIKELQQTIENNENLNKQKDDDIKQIDDEMMNLKDKIIDLSNHLDSLTSKQQDLNNKISQKDKTIAENKTKGLSARCLNMHLLETIDASNIDKCSQCTKQFSALDQMKRCSICDYNKCNSCYNLRAGSRRNTRSHSNTSTRRIIIKKISASTDQKIIQEIPNKKSSVTILKKREWEQLKTVPKSDFSEAVQINLNDFIVATKAGIYKYNSNKNKGWRLYMKYPSSYKGPIVETGYSKGNMFDKCTLSVDRNKQILYMFTKAMSGGRMAEVELKSKKWKITKGLKSAGDIPISVLIDERVHIFSGNYFLHLMWNPSVKSLKCVDGFGNIEKNRKNSFGVAYIEKNNSILLFGGNTGDIWRFKINQHKWVKCGELSVRGISSFAWIITNDYKYIVIFRGDYDSSDILILDVDTMKTTISPIKMPFKNNRTSQQRSITAMLMDNSGKYEILLKGYVRKLFGNYRNVGNDVIKLILIWCLTNDIHLFNKTNGEHWKIDVETVLGFFETDNKGYNV